MINRYDLYVGTNSRYYFDDVAVLKNKLGIKNLEELEKAEMDIVNTKLAMLEIKSIKGDFDKEHLFQLHKYLFENIYDFAGKIRTEDISKAGFPFCQTQFIDKQLSEVFSKFKREDWSSFTKDEFAEKLAIYMADLNVIHPFREGNGRCLREFIREFVVFNGYILDWSLVKTSELLNAMITSVKDCHNLAKCLKEVIKKY